MVAIEHCYPKCDSLNCLLLVHDKITVAIVCHVTNKYLGAYQSPRRLVKHACDFLVGLGWSLILCISNKLISDADCLRNILNSSALEHSHTIEINCFFET